MTGFDPATSLGLTFQQQQRKLHRGSREDEVLHCVRILNIQARAREIEIKAKERERVHDDGAVFGSMAGGKGHHASCQD